MNGVLDLLVLGSGVAGLSAAVRAAKTHGMQVGVLTKAELDQATTRWAQGEWRRSCPMTPTRPICTWPTRWRPGPGCAIRTPCGAGRRGSRAVNELIALGAIFDRRGELLLAREAGTRTRGARRRCRHRRRGGAGLGGCGPPNGRRGLRALVRAGPAHRWRPLRRGGGMGPSGERAEVQAHHVLVATGEPASCSR